MYLTSAFISFALLLNAYCNGEENLGSLFLGYSCPRTDEELKEVEASSGRTREICEKKCVLERAEWRKHNQTTDEYMYAYERYNDCYLGCVDLLTAALDDSSEVSGFSLPTSNFNEDNGTFWMEDAKVEAIENEINDKCNMECKLTRSAMEKNEDDEDAKERHLGCLLVCFSELDVHVQKISIFMWASRACKCLCFMTFQLCVFQQKTPRYCHALYMEMDGGKDSCYNLCQCVDYGHIPACVAQLIPPSGCDELDSYMFQTVGHEAVPFISCAMSLPILRRTICGHSVVCDMQYSPNEQDEVEDLFSLMKEAKEQYQVEAVAVGAICSNYQKERVANVCERLDLDMLAYLWQRDQADLLQEMLNAGLHAILVKTSSLGLDPSLHLGKELNEMLPHFLTLNEKYGFNVCGEGGEYETLVTDCSIFRYKLLITNAEVTITSADSVCAVGHLRNLSFRLESKT
ncbi:hypothetical protein M514_06601 [Trichuris suis]|uniref:Diphthine--ammonia ligase n=1 Tax=Trichuris suis TaxID=68888 RepID=A0A085N2I9_9BILA|nr:hypothetical protein M514_06601 [Trichuris suis]